MSSSPGAKPTRGWRPEGAGEKKRPAGPRWRNPQQALPLAAPRSRWPWGRLLVLLAAFSVFVGLLVWVSLWLRPPRDTTLVLMGAGYHENLAIPHNAYGWQGLRDLAEQVRGLRFPAGEKGAMHVAHDPREVKTGEAWDRDLSHVQGKNLVLFLALHGGSDRHGGYLLKNDAFLPGGPDTPDVQDRLRLPDIFKRIKELARVRNVVLILEATQIAAHWQLGMLHNDFARELEKLEPQIADIPNLIVLNSSDVDQRSWVSEEWRRTIFTHFVIEGLRGAADAADGEPPDGRISAWELFRYVQRNVERWTRSNRGARQTPALYPRGAEGQQRARKVHLTLAQTYTPPDPHKLQPFTPPKELVQAWEKMVQLQNTVDYPGGYTPHLWRLYQATLLRYEQLVRAEVALPALGMLGRLRNLEQEILQAQVRDIASAQGTLAMPAAEGLSPAMPNQVYALLQKLWDASPKDLNNVWKEVLATPPSPPSQGGVNTAATPPSQGGVTGGSLPSGRLRLFLAELLLERVAQDPASYFQRGYTILQLLDDPLYPRPAEAHFMVMLRRDAPGWTGQGPTNDEQKPALPADLLQLALQVRLRAEKAALGLSSMVDPRPQPGSRYAYAEQLVPWFRDWIDQADQPRRLGQDLLFAGDKVSWALARKHLTEADALYTKAQDQALRIRHALGIRDGVLPRLYWYAQWLARRSSAQEKLGPGESTSTIERMESLCQQTHQLVQLLEEPVPGSESKSPSAEYLQKLVDLADRVQNAFQDFEAQLHIAWNNLDDVDLTSVWRDIDDALAVPFADVDLRVKLLQRRSRIALRFLVVTALSTDQNSVGTPAGEDSAKDHARRQGRMAMAVLGQRWFHECGGELETFDQVSHRLSHFALEEKWWDSLLVAGEEIGLRWQRLPAAINRLVEESKKSSTAKAWPSLEQADRLTRLIDGPGVLSLAHNAILYHRQMHLVNLLVEQARRTFLDHWFAEDPAREPYYRALGLRFLADARNMPVTRQGVTDQRLAELDAALKKDGDLRLTLQAAPGFIAPAAPKADAMPTLQLTSEDTFPLKFLLSAPKGADVPPGFPVLWVDAGPHLKVLSPDAGLRLAPELRDASEMLVHCVLASPLPREAEGGSPDQVHAQQTSFQIHGVYRGQPISCKARIDVHPMARIAVSEFPKPLGAGVAVRASKEIHKQFGASNGAIAFVLDCSGSMGAPQGQTFGPTTKFAEATGALARILAKVPRGTLVSLWIFGQAMGPEKTANDAEKTVQRLLPPTSWDPDDPNQLNNLMARVRYPAIEPWNETPLMRTMLTAAQTDLADAVGFKSMIVITDGMDNRFDKDKEINPARKEIRTVLRQTFADIEVNLLAFKIADPKEEERLRAQFGVIEEMPLPGRIYSIKDADVLVATVEKVLRQKLSFWIDREDNSPLPGFPESGLDVSVDGANDQWVPGGLAPGAYKVRVHTNKRLTRSFALNRGDLLLLELAPSKVPGAPPGSVGFERVVYSLADHPLKPAREKINWRLAALMNRSLPLALGSLDQRAKSQEPRAGLQLLTTLERKNDPLVPTLQQVIAAKTWFEVTPAGQDQDVPYQHWHFQAGYPAPAWSVQAPGWPSRPGTSAPARPTLRAWWSPDQDPPAHAILEKGHHFVALGDLVNQAVRMLDQEIVIESVQVEDHVVQTQAALRDQPAKWEQKPCLVVRLRHPLGSPVWVRPRGLDTAGAQHRFYADVGKYTGLFWPVSRDQASLALKSLEIVSVPAFKKWAEDNQYMIELDNLYEPQPNDPVPVQPVDLTAVVQPLDGQAEAWTPTATAEDKNLGSRGSILFDLQPSIPSVPFAPQKNVRPRDSIFVMPIPSFRSTVPGFHEHPSVPFPERLSPSFPSLSQGPASTWEPSPFLVPTVSLPLAPTVK